MDIIIYCWEKAFVRTEFDEDKLDFEWQYLRNPVRDHYSFHFADPQKKEYMELGRQDTRYLSTEVAGGFTGVMIGLYASSNGKSSNAKAYFDWFDYLPKE